MAIQSETIYYIENPEAGIKKFVTESQLKFENIIKDIFGVAFVNDLQMMIQYNKKFQECICKANQISEDEISLDLIFRVATKEDIKQFKKEYLARETANHKESIAPPFNNIIHLHEGIFKWNDKKYSYIKIK